MAFDISLTLGDVLQLVTFITGILVVAYKVGTRLTRLETKMDILWKGVHKFTCPLTSNPSPQATHIHKRG